MGRPELLQALGEGNRRLPLPRAYLDEQERRGGIQLVEHAHDVGVHPSMLIVRRRWVAGWVEAGAGVLEVSHKGVHRRLENVQALSTCLGADLGTRAREHVVVSRVLRPRAFCVAGAHLLVPSRSLLG